MIRKKIIRDIINNKNQFLSILIMIIIGTAAFVGIKSYMDGLQRAGDTFYKESNLQDINVLGTNFNKEDIYNLKQINNVKEAELKLNIQVQDTNNNKKSYLLSVIESNNLSKFYIEKGEKFSNKKGIWIDSYYAKNNNLQVGDTISFEYDNYKWDEIIKGIIYIPDHLYVLKDKSTYVPDYYNYGYIYMSYIELEDYLKTKALNEINERQNTKLTMKDFDKSNPNYDYTKNIPYNYIMIDVITTKDNRNTINSIKEKVPTTIEVIDIRDDYSYTTYKEEIEEGKSYIGIFATLFLGLSILTVITTMSRIIKKQSVQIGILKSLGYSNKKITIHYISYGLYISIIGTIIGTILGKYLIGRTFINMEMNFFEVPNAKEYLSLKTILTATISILVTCIATYIACRKELKKKPADSMKDQPVSISTKGIKITTKPFFNRFKFQTKWNIRDIIRNKFRTITGIIGITGCSSLVIISLGMSNTINSFIDKQFKTIYNYKTSIILKDNISEDSLKSLTDNYGNNTSETLNIVIDNKELKTQLFINESNDYVKVLNNKKEYIKLDNNDGIYITYKYAKTNNYKIGDSITWHIYGTTTKYTSKIVGYYKDYVSQGFTCTKEYINSLNIPYNPDRIYTNKEVIIDNNILKIQPKEELKDNISSLLSVINNALILVIILAIILGYIIIYSISILSYNEKEYQFSTLKVLGFNTKQIRNIFIQQNKWISTLSVLLGIPIGYYLITYLVRVGVDNNYDISTYIKWYTYIIGTLGTYIVTFIISKYISKKIIKIDMVSSLKNKD